MTTCFPRRRLSLALLLALAPTPALRAQQPAPLGSCTAPVVAADAGVERRSLYVPMPDGTRLAADVFLPEQLPAGRRLPTVLVSTRYWRAVQDQPIGANETYWIRHGYAFVYADVRGTGASFGQWYYPWSPKEVSDLGGLVDWIATQSWSDGQVGSIGTSYTGNTAQLVAATNRPAVKAVVPRFMDFDVYADLTYPGGLVNQFIIHDWGQMVHAMDMNDKRGQPPRGVRPVDGDGDEVLLGAAVQDHHKNPPLDASMAGIKYRDDVIAAFGGATNDQSGTYRYRADIERSKVPIFGWASWLDAGTSQGVLNRFMNWKNPQLVVVGPWSHGGGHHASPFLPADRPTEPSSARQLDQATCFFDQYLKGAKQGMASPHTLIYYTLGEAAWKKTSTWPIPGTTMRRYYLSGGQALSTARPAAGTDRYQVDFEATTGTENRWYTQLGGNDVVYPERSEADRRLLTYTSAPLEQDLEVTGQGIMTLQIASTATDGSFIVYLEDVGPDGRVTYVTEGMLRGLMRKVSTATPPYRTTYPYHSFLKQDGEPLVPGQVATLRFQLLPTSVLFRAGHRIRLALAGADKDTFLRIPAEDAVTWTVHRGGDTQASFIDLPVVPRR